jgi:hypothetical protein
MEEFYKKKIIRDFLSLFSESKWKNLSILLIEYAILTLRKNYQVSSLSLEDIEELVNDMIEEEERNKKKNLKKINNNQNNNSNNKSIQTSHLNSSNNRPSSNWRKGETKTIFDVDNNNINNPIGKNINIENSNDISLMTRMSKVKMIDEILYPKQNKFLNNKKDNNLFNNNNLKKPNYKTTYNNTYTKKLIETPNNNIKYRRNLSNSSSSSNLKFKSGLQMLKMGNNNNRAISSNKNLRNNSRRNSYSNNRKNYNFVPSKIKAQVEADKKIYEMLKKNQKNEKKELGEYESSITYKKSENMSFEDELSSFM